jgi:hypothetical protein
MGNVEAEAVEQDKTAAARDVLLVKIADADKDWMIEGGRRTRAEGTGAEGVVRG